MNTYLLRKVIHSIPGVGSGVAYITAIDKKNFRSLEIAELVPKSATRVSFTMIEKVYELAQGCYKVCEQTETSIFDHEYFFEVVFGVEHTLEVFYKEYLDREMKK